MAHVVGQMIQAEAVHQLQVVQTVGHGKRLVGRHARPVHEFGTVERQQADQRDAVAQVGQFAHLGEIRNVLTLSNNNNTSTTVSNFLFWNISWNICLMISTQKKKFISIQTHLHMPWTRPDVDTSKFKFPVAVQRRDVIGPAINSQTIFFLFRGFKIHDEHGMN